MSELFSGVMKQDNRVAEVIKMMGLHEREIEDKDMRRCVETILRIAEKEADRVLQSEIWLLCNK